MTKFESLLTRIDRLGDRLASLRTHGGPNSDAPADVDAIMDEHARLRARLLAAKPDAKADSLVEREVETLLDSFDRWARHNDAEFGRH